MHSARHKVCWETSSRVWIEEGVRRYLRAREDDINSPQDWMFAEEESS